MEKLARVIRKKSFVKAPATIITFPRYQAMSKYEKQIGSELQIQPSHVDAVIDLLDSGNTVPFIARYRKEATGSLDEEQIRQIKDRLKRYRALDDRRETIIASIAEQGKLTPELHKHILDARTATALEDLYQPYKPKRQTKADAARQNGLQPLADLILTQIQGQQSIAEIAAPFVNESVPTVDMAFEGARDIVAEIYK